MRLCEANEFASIAMDVLIERITARAGQDGGISALVGTVPDNLVGEFFRMLVFSHMGDSPDSFAPGDTLELLLSLDDRQLSHFMRELSIFTAVNNMMPNDQDNPYQINIQSLLDMIESDSSERHSSIFESLTGMSVSADRHRQNADRILSW
ncbi:TPA: hypothetical protein EYP38_02185 [Candidatus Micrarchaeota archaeon]|nr:hypothetical protein [Candidatus Micrarchaeota archaeon]